MCRCQVAHKEISFNSLQIKSAQLHFLFMAWSLHFLLFDTMNI